MAVDQTVLGRCVSELMDQIEADHDETSIVSAIIIVRLPTEDGLAVRVRAETNDPLGAIGMIEIAKTTILGASGRPG